MNSIFVNRAKNADIALDCVNIKTTASTTKEQTCYFWICRRNFLYPDLFLPIPLDNLIQEMYNIVNVDIRFQYKHLMSSNIHWNMALFISLLRNSVCSVHNIYWSFSAGTSLRNPNNNLIYCLSTNIWSFSKEMVFTLKRNLYDVSNSANC